MEIIKCGSVVTAHNGTLKGTITAVFIRFESVNYEFGYWDEGNYKVAILNECEVAINDENKQKIGFK